MDEQVSTDEGDHNDSIDVEHNVLDNAAEMNIADDENSDGREDIDYESNIESDASWADNNSTGYDSEDLIDVESLAEEDVFRGWEHIWRLVQSGVLPFPPGFMAP
jgi:hypothetical protein